MDKFIINIGRQLGSGGRAIGHILSKELGIAYYDKEILSLAAKTAASAKRYSSTTTSTRASSAHSSVRSSRSSATRATSFTPTP